MLFEVDPIPLTEPVELLEVLDEVVTPFDPTEAVLEEVEFVDPDPIPLTLPLVVLVDV